jgi:Ferritin-like
MHHRFHRPASKIETIDSLRAHLQIAIELEHATIPAYLCGLYTIRDGTNIEPTQVIRGVVMEEMLHISLAANVLNAIGGSPSLNHPTFVPDYPATLPDSDRHIVIHLAKFSRESVATFQLIERPAKADAPAQADRYHTIGQFYKALVEGLKRVCPKDKYFTGDPARQVGPEAYYGGGGSLIRVTDLDSAMKALNIIVAEGEGLPHSIWDSDRKFFRQHEEPAHYFRYTQLLAGRYFTPDDTPATGPTGPLLSVDWDAVYDMHPNPKAADYRPGSDLHRRTVEFNQAYTRLLNGLHRAFNGEPGRLGDAVGGMYELKYLAQALIRTPRPDGRGNAGPSFEFDRGTAPRPDAKSPSDRSSTRSREGSGRAR